MSSMKINRRLPGGGPYVSLVLFSTLASRFLCTSRDEVLLEKFMFSSIYNSQHIIYRLIETNLFNTRGNITN